MALMNWTSKLSVGVATLDEDHKGMVGIINELHEGIVGGSARQTLEKVLDVLMTYTQAHFQREETLFIETGYPLAAEHCREHAALTERVKLLQDRFRRGSLTCLNIETMTFLRGWLFVHIQGSDRKYSAHLNACGIR